MYLKTESSGAPESKRVDEKISLKMKVKDGVFSTYNRETKEKQELKEVTIVPINNDRFTIKASEGAPGEFVFSGVYRSAKQNINVMKSSGGSTKSILEGNWASIKDAAKASGLKYTKLFYCLIKTGDTFEKAVFDLQGIAAIQWGKIDGVDIGESITLKVSEEKNFESSGKRFYSMEKVGFDTIPAEADKLAQEYASEVDAFFKSEDERYEYYKDSKIEEANAENQIAAADQEEQGAIEDISPEDIPFK